jgi:hypothetical protein
MNPRNDLLLLAGKILTILLQAAMAFGAAVLLVILPFVTLFSGDLARGFAEGSDIPVQDIPTLPFAGIILVGLAIVLALFLFFGKLRAIIATVGAGDPFAPANAGRLNMMAWLMLSTQLLTIPLVFLVPYLTKWADSVETVTFHGQVGGLDMTGILLVIILFILARVFRHGAAMREDLEGTV